MASKPVKLQRPDSGHRVQSLLEIRTWPRALMETTAAIVTAQPRNENPVAHVQAGEMAPQFGLTLPGLTLPRREVARAAVRSAASTRAIRLAAFAALLRSAW